MAQAGGSGPALRCAQRMAPGNTDLGQTTHLRHYSQPAAHRVQEYVNAFVERATKIPPRYCYGADGASHTTTCRQALHRGFALCFTSSNHHGPRFSLFDDWSDARSLGSPQEHSGDGGAPPQPKSVHAVPNGTSPKPYSTQTSEEPSAMDSWPGKGFQPYMNMEADSRHFSAKKVHSHLTRVRGVATNCANRSATCD